MKHLLFICTCLLSFNCFAQLGSKPPHLPSEDGKYYLKETGHYSYLMPIADTTLCCIYLGTLVDSVLCGDNELFKFSVSDSTQQIHFRIYNQEMIARQVMDSGGIYNREAAYIYTKSYRFP